MAALDRSNPGEFAMSSHKVISKLGKMRHPVPQFKLYFDPSKYLRGFLLDI
jgi:hypothetical protein